MVRRHSLIPRPGFTLVELLVVIAIIGILVALLLPAVQAAREAARRTQCKNQVKQIMLAMHTHVDTHKAFPSGGIAPWPNLKDYSTAGGQPFGPERQGLSWAFQILPFMEEGAAYGTAASKSNATKEEITAALNDTLITHYFCPSRRGPTRHPGSGRWLMDYAAAHTDMSRSKWDTFDGFLDRACTFKGVWGGAGSHVPGMALTVRAINGYTGFWGVIVRSNYFVPAGGGGRLTEDTGFYSKINFGKIVDGSSKTLVIGEKRLKPSQYQAGAWHDDKGWSDGWDPDVIRYTMCPPESDGEDSTTDGNFGSTFGAAHPGGFNVGLADASVRTFSYDIDLELFNRLGHRADGETVDADAF